MKHIGIVGVTAEGSALCYRLIVAMATKYIDTFKVHPEISIHNFSFHEYYTAGPTVDGSWNQVQFNRPAPRILEIGFGSGTSLVAMAQAEPDHDFVGIETHLPGIGNLFLQVAAQNVKNLRIYYADAVQVLQECIPDECFDIIQIFFPDPWQKRRHHKRRLIQPDFVNLLAKKLKINGTLHLATDWADYAKHMMTVLSNATQFINSAGIRCFAERSTQRPLVTKFESRGKNAGREIFELRFVRV